MREDEAQMVQDNENGKRADVGGKRKSVPSTRWPKYNELYLSDVRIEASSSFYFDLCLRIR
jgi:hypothetical protein